MTSKSNRTRFPLAPPVASLYHTLRLPERLGFSITALFLALEVLSLRRALSMQVRRLQAVHL